MTARTTILVGADMTARTIVRVEIRNVYGNERIYPACDSAAAFAQLAGTKTLSRHNIDAIKRLGYVIEVVTPTL